MKTCCPDHKHYLDRGNFNIASQMYPCFTCATQIGREIVEDAADASSPFWIGRARPLETDTDIRVTRLRKELKVGDCVRLKNGRFYDLREVNGDLFVCEVHSGSNTRVLSGWGAFSDITAVLFKDEDPLSRAAEASQVRTYPASGTCLAFVELKQMLNTGKATVLCKEDMKTYVRFIHARGLGLAAYPADSVLSLRHLMQTGIRFWVRSDYGNLYKQFLQPVIPKKMAPHTWLQYSINRVCDSKQVPLGISEAVPSAVKIEHLSTTHGTSIRTEGQLPAFMANHSALEEVLPHLVFEAPMHWQDEGEMRIPVEDKTASILEEAIGLAAVLKEMYADHLCDTDTGDAKEAARRAKLVAEDKKFASAYHNEKLQQAIAKLDKEHPDPLQLRQPNRIRYGHADLEDYDYASQWKAGAAKQPRAGCTVCGSLVGCMHPRSKLRPEASKAREAELRVRAYLEEKLRTLEEGHPAEYKNLIRSMCKSMWYGASPISFSLTSFGGQRILASTVAENPEPKK